MKDISSDFVFFSSPAGDERWPECLFSSGFNGGYSSFVLSGQRAFVPDKFQLQLLLKGVKLNNREVNLWKRQPFHPRSG
jgi:hypothetical protein